MSCKPVCKLCNHLVLSQAVAFTGGNLEINLPAGSYRVIINTKRAIFGPHEGPYED